MHSSVGSSDLTYNVDFSCPFSSYLFPSSATYQDSSGESPFPSLTITFFSPSHESPPILQGSSYPCPKEVYKASELATAILYFSGPISYQPVRPYYCKGEARNLAKKKKKNWQPMGCLQLLRLLLGFKLLF